MFGPSKNEIALTQQLAQLTQTLEQTKNAAEYHRRHCQELESKLATAQKEAQDAHIAAGTLDEQVAALRANLERLAGDSPFIQIEREWILFTDVKWIKGDGEGRITKINHHDCYTSEISAQDLVRLVSAHYRRRSQPDQE
jgi:phage terminase large subunit-like protein